MSVKVGDMQVLWCDQIWMCVKERPWKVQLGLWVRCGSSSYVQTYSTLPQETLQQIAGGDTLLEFQNATTSLLETKHARVRRDTGSRRGVLVRQEEETLHRNVGRVLG